MCTETCFVHINYIKHYEVNKFRLSFQGFGHSAVVLFHPKLRLSTCPCHSISSSVIPRSVILLLNPIHPSIHPSIHAVIFLRIFLSCFLCFQFKDCPWKSISQIFFHMSNHCHGSSVSFNVFSSIHL